MDTIKITVPDGVSGNWRVDTITVTKGEAELAAMRACFSSMRGRGVIEPGEYKRLMDGGVTVMSNTPDEIRDQRFLSTRQREMF